MSATATATMEQETTVDPRRKELLLGESVQANEFTVTLWSIGSASCVNVSCNDWTEQFPVVRDHDWVKNDAGKILANLAPIPRGERKITSIDFLRWDEFLTALRVLHKPATK